MEGVTVEVRNWGDAVFASLTAALQNFLGFLPQLVGALIILVIGWFVAGLLAGLVERAWGNAERGPEATIDSNGKPSLPSSRSAFSSTPATSSSVIPTPT